MKLVNFLLILFVANGNAFIVPKLLLPYYDQIQVNYTISSEEGCYKWRSLNSGIASIQAIPEHYDEECTKSAIVFVESKVPSRKITLILAENEVTGTVLQCDVIIDRINSIDIISRTRELYLEDPPETLKIRALDAEGNTFSSTAGMLFDWNLIHDTEAQSDMDQVTMPAHTILSIQKFIDTEYKAEPYVEQLEREGLQSDTILLSGLQTGTAYVAAQLTSMMDVKSAKIRLTVRDKVFLIPSGDVWLPQHASLRYIVEQWRNGRSSEIKMPNQQYFLQLSPAPSEGAIVTLDPQTSIVVGQRIGHSQLFLMDKNLKQQTVQASSDIYVTEPAYLKFSIQPNDRWVLENGRHYIIRIHMYDSMNHRLWPANNVRITANIDSRYFKVLDSSVNGTWHSVQAIKKGQIEIYAKLNGIIKQDKKMKQYDPVIEATQLAEIFDPITVNPPIVIFPWQPQPVLYKYQLNADGGSGNYTWTIDDDQFAIVTSVGVVMTKVGAEQDKVHKTGSSVVRASDVRNPAHWGSAQVWLLPVEEILFAKSHREAEINHYLDVYLTMLARVNADLVPVVDCRESGVVWKIQDPSVFEQIEDFKVSIPGHPGTNACIGRRLKALREGYTTLTATYVQTRMDGTSTKLEASITIAAFPALKPIDPPVLAVVSLDSIKVLQFKGGPIRWPHWHAGYERKSSTGKLEMLQISPVLMSQQEHHVMAKCLRLGDAEVRLMVHNKPCNTNPMPVQVSVTVRVLCAVPSRIEMTVPSLLPTCPLHNTHVVQTITLVNRQMPVNVTAYDGSGHIFDNFTSIYLSWSSDRRGTSFERSSALFTPVDGTEQRKHIVNKIIGLPNMEGEQTITVALTKYQLNTNKDVCKMYNCDKLDPVVSGSVGILVVPEPSLAPSQLLLYNHQNCSSHIQISGGSGHFSHRIKQEGNTTIITENKNNRLLISSKHSGKSQLQVTDMCLDSVAVVTSDIVVAEVGKLHLQAPPRMELDTWAQASVKVIDNFGHNLPARFISFIDIQLSTTVDDIIIADAVHAAPGKDLVVESDINANNVGTTMLTAVLTLRDGRLVASNAVRVMVFPPLQLLPPVVTLIRHATYQLVITGGPRSDFTIEYTISKGVASPIVNVSQSGLVHALHLGNASISARAIMHDGAVFHCKAPSIVRVVQLTGIRIDAPLTQFHVGGIIPLHVAGLPDGDKNPMSFGSAVPGLIFKWETANPSVAKLQTVHAQAGIETRDSLSFTVLVEGISAGHSVVRVRVTAEDPLLHQMTKNEFYAEISLMIFDPLSLTSSPSKQWKSSNNFLMTQMTSHQLQTNRDGVAMNVAYEVLRDTHCSPHDDIDADKCISVDQKGVITSYQNQCQVTLLVTSVEKFGINQTLALHVLIRPVTYIVARAVNKFYIGDESAVVHAFPLSATIRFVVDQFDDSGDLFDATSHSVILNQNRYDLIEIEPDLGNRSFVVRTPLEGTTVMSVASYLQSAANPTAVYYFPINVMSAITPRQQNAVIGVKFCFTSQFVNEDGSSGAWHTSNPKAVLVDESSGAAVAVAKTTADVFYSVNGFVASAQVVASPFSAHFLQDKIPNYVLGQKRTYFLPIEITDFQGYSGSSKCEGLNAEMEQVANLVFRCSARFRSSVNENLFNAEAKYITKLGSYACVLNGEEAATEEDADRLATLDDSVVVKLEVKSSEFGAVRFGDVAMDFVPSFVYEVSSLKLTIGSHVTLCVKANSIVYRSLQVVPSDASILEIEEESHSIPGRFCFLISVRSGEVTSHISSIRVSSKLTLQDERIDLTIQRKDGRLITSSSCPSPVDGAWRHTGDVMDSYLAYLTTAAVVFISTAMLIAAITAFKWVSGNAIQPPSASFLSRTPPPYEASPPRHQSSPGSTPKVRLWSRYYSPQQAGPSSG